MLFIDKVKIFVQAGKGGDGTVAFRREAHVPFGGPAGGDGGNGGSIVFEATTHLSTLLDLRYNRQYIARNGENGMAKKMHGASAEDLVVKVPIGTIVTDEKTGKVLADLTVDNQRAVICKAGRGGRGNARFATSRNPAPEICERGELGEAYDIVVELKLLADAGLVGFPSVGKSTLLSIVSRAKPEIADYHFTTIVPNLGVVQSKDGRSFVLADLPGLIEGASQGKGLGHQFLRHIERCRVIVHVVDMGSAEGRDPFEDYQIINKELEDYKYRLLERPQVVIANKMDLPDAEGNLRKFREQVGPDVEIFPMTAYTTDGIDAVLYRVADLLEQTASFSMFDEEEVEENVIYTFEPNNKNKFEIRNEGNGVWSITGERLERMVEMTSFTSDDSVNRFAKKMREMGIDDALRERGVQDGDTIKILDIEFEFMN